MEVPKVRKYLSLDRIRELVKTVKGTLHRTVAAEMFEVSVEQVTPAMRHVAKEATFCALYGGDQRDKLLSQYY